MTQATETFDSFAYQAQTPEGQSVSGTIDAGDVEKASALLHSLRLRVLEIAPVRRAARAKALGGEDFLAFNQQLMHLTRAGLPVERGLRLIAQDMNTGRLAESIRQVAADLEGGTPLGEAFEKHRDKFPPLYAKLISAGVQTSNLPGMLLNLGRHMEMVYRLRAMLWRSVAYPIAVLVGLAGIMFFLSKVVVPGFATLFKDFGVKLPMVTQFLLWTPTWLPSVAIAIIVFLVGIPLWWRMLRLSGGDRTVIDRLIIPMPLIGPVIWRNLVARWCDAAKLGVLAGLDLPRAIDLANESVGSPGLTRDGKAMIAALEAGKPIDLDGPTHILPATVPAAISLASQTGNLPAALGTLGEMYEQQAEVRLGMIPGILTPLLVILIAAMISFVIAGLALPLLLLIRAISGG